MKLTQPLLYEQLAALGLKAIVCECGGAVWCFGMNTDTGIINASCISCGLTTGDMELIASTGLRHGVKKLPLPPAPNQEGGNGVN